MKPAPFRTKPMTLSEARDIGRRFQLGEFLDHDQVKMAFRVLIGESGK